MMIVYNVENGFTHWKHYYNKEDAEGMVRYLNKRYHNGYYIREAEETEAQKKRREYLEQGIN